MSALIRLLKFSAISLAALTGLAGCRPEYVHQSYQETYVPAYGPVAAYRSSPTYAYYPSAPTYVERRTVIVPHVVVAPSRVVYAGPQANDRRHIEERRDVPQQGGHVRVDPPQRAQGNRDQAIQRSRNEGVQPGVRLPAERVAGPVGQPAGKPHSPDRRGPRDKDG
jgi:hypothetical protein